MLHPGAWVSSGRLLAWDGGSILGRSVLPANRIAASETARVNALNLLIEV